MTELVTAQWGVLGKVDAKIENKTLIAEAPEAGFSINWNLVKGSEKIKMFLPEGVVRTIGSGLMDLFVKNLP